MNMPAEANAPVVPLWIAGKTLISTGPRYGDVFNPATGQVIRRVPFTDPGGVDLAVRTAHEAYTSWSRVPPLRRARVLMRYIDLLNGNRKALARLISEEHGKTVEDAEGSLQRGIEVVEFASGIPHLLKGEFSESVGRGVDAYSLRQPIGVCAGITPFNFPAMVPMWMYPVAIACGNTFVLKPSEKVPSTSVRLAELFTEAGLPDGVMNVVHGGSETVDALLVHPGVKAISFVGSTPVARHVYETAARHGKRVQALGGAKNHAIVLPDADVEATAAALVGAAFGSAGQRCMAISAVVAVGGVGDALVEAIRARAAALVVGPGGDTGSEMGPLVTDAHRNRVREYVNGAVEQGATLALDGRPLSVNRPGFFLGPTLIDRVTPEMDAYRDEIFGPVLVVLRVADIDEALQLVNRNPYGNGVAIFTRSGSAARRLQAEVEVGMVGINVPIPVPMAFFSFGGWKSSLFGDLHVHGTEGVRFYTRTKAVTARWQDEWLAEEGARTAMPVHG